MLALLSTFSWQEVRHHGWRSAAAVLAVMLGVALAFSVHLINASALDEFAGAARSAGGQPDVELRATQGAMDEAFYGRIATDPQVAWASPVLELQTLAIAADGSRRTVRVLGIDALVAASLAPDLRPVPAEGADRLAMLAPGQVFLNPAASVALPADTVRVQEGLAGRVRELHAASGRKVSLLGWSLGGIYAREVAKAGPGAVRQVITLATPFRSVGGGNHAGTLFRMIGGDTSRLTPQLQAHLRQRPPVPVTSIYSRKDGMVSWKGCLETPGPDAENVEVDASHLGMPTHAEVLRIVADRLAQPEGEWRPYGRAAVRGEPHTPARTPTLR